MNFDICDCFIDAITNIGSVFERKAAA